MIIARVEGGRSSEGQDDPASGTTGDNNTVAPRTSISRYPSSYSHIRVLRMGPERASYSPFRDTFFHDPSVNPVLRGEGWEPDRASLVRDSKRNWKNNGPSLRTRSPKTATCPGSAFRNQGISADRLYSSSRNSIGYDVHRSLRGSSLCGTTKRFDQNTPTPECVGPGSYNNMPSKTAIVHQPPHTEPPKPGMVVTPTDRLRQWGGPPDAREMDSASEWKHTSEKPTATVYSFQRARNASWIEQVEERQRRTNPEARPLPPAAASSITKRRAEERLPVFLQGMSSPFATKEGAASEEKQYRHEQPSPKSSRSV